MIRLIFFPAARLIDPVSSENAPRFPLSEIQHTENEHWKSVKSLKLREILVKTPPSQYFKNSGRIYCVRETSFIYATFPSKVCVFTLRITGAAALYPPYIL